MKTKKLKLLWLGLGSAISLPFIIACAPTDATTTTPENPGTPGNDNDPSKLAKPNMPVEPTVPSINSSPEMPSVMSTNFSKQVEISGTHNFTSMQNTRDLGLLGITQTGELMQYNSTTDQWLELAKDLEPNGSFYVARGRISMVTKTGFYALYENGKTIYSNISISKRAGFAHLGFASIVVVEENGKYYLARIEKQGNNLQATVVLKTKELLETSIPVQVNFSGGNNDDGHIAVLAQPTTKYGHYVLGIRQNAAQLIFVERHDLSNLATPLEAGENDVFEDNQARIITLNGKNYLAVVKASTSRGGSVAIVGQEGNALKVISQTPYIGNANRWNSPMIVNNRLIVTKTPHIGGSSFIYDFSDLNRPIETLFANNISPHQIGQHRAATYAFNGKYLFAPANNWNSLEIIELATKTKISKALPAKIQNIAANNNAAFVNLVNGKILVFS